jgi:hypothetical protein
MDSLEEKKKGIMIKDRRRKNAHPMSFRWLSYRHSAGASQLILVQSSRKDFRVALYYKSG